MDQQKLDGITPKRAWFGRKWGRLWPWSLMGWLWTALFVALAIGLTFYIKHWEVAHGPAGPKWVLAYLLLMVVYLIVAYSKSRKT